ncbi:hypothetical protein HOU00_gp188 [Caulobacter phage CcrPW]|uniref:Uncharacterized protein n=1 Tax=Caulobacter phage CcrPW TaxID=2283271 RepID=A0A385EDP3_9CAUD|nr:hypothetical protein HOU00_gp188 [Caulobacter phage CcrPW]AXQ68937.1 hypothetical protein CcrPW_gp398 [Caulobacter phage CcrPW]
MTLVRDGAFHWLNKMTRRERMQVFDKQDPAPPPGRPYTTEEKEAFMALGAPPRDPPPIVVRGRRMDVIQRDRARDIDLLLRPFVSDALSYFEGKPFVWPLSRALAEALVGAQGFDRKRAYLIGKLLQEEAVRAGYQPETPPEEHAP